MLLHNMPTGVTFFSYLLSDSLQSSCTDCTKGEGKHGRPNGRPREDTAEREQNNGPARANDAGGAATRPEQKKTEKRENKTKAGPQRCADCTKKGRAQRQASETDKRKAKLRAQDSDPTKTKFAKIDIAEGGASASKRTERLEAKGEIENRQHKFDRGSRAT